VLLRIAHDPGAAARHRGQPGHHRAQRAASSPTWPQPVTWSSTKTAAATATRSRRTSRCPNPHPGTRHRRSPRPPRGRRREAAADPNPARLRPPQPSLRARTPGRRPTPGSPGRLTRPQTPDRPGHRRPGPGLSRVGCLLLSNNDRYPVYGGPVGVSYRLCKW